ncbi:MAG: AAA family ATPase [Myxococcales bacterium FL481]|nr:MAG: AAA family ATPase [Myxococcales bacterium FL481]
MIAAIAWTKPPRLATRAGMTPPSRRREARGGVALGRLRRDPWGTATALPGPRRGSRSVEPGGLLACVDVERPQRFPGVRGHVAVQARLARAHLRGRLHHALMFTGPEGVGKATVGRALACALNCAVEPGWGCGKCATCQRFLAGRHPDLQVVEPSGKGRLITAAAAEDVVLRCLHAPYEAAAHVVVLDDAHRLHEAAANKLLKAIEEPRAGVQFVLVTDNLEAMLPTLISRSTVVEFGGLDEADLVAIVDQALADTNAPVDPAQRQLAVQLAGGSAGAAVRVASDRQTEALCRLVAALSAAAEAGPSQIFAGMAAPLWKLWSETVADTPEPGAEPGGAEEPGLVVIRGKAGRKKSARKKKAGKKKATKGKAAAETPAKQRAAAARVSELWLLHLRECLRGRAGVPGAAVPGTRDRLIRQIRGVSEFQSRLRRNPNVRLALEQTLLEMSP